VRVIISAEQMKMFANGPIALCFLFQIHVSLSADGIFNYAAVAVNGNYSCQELQKWSATEKHYSNDRKKSLFEIMTDCEKQPVIVINDVAYSPSAADKKYFRSNTEKCKHHDKVAVSFCCCLYCNVNRVMI
jgi:hypothetical protein